MRKSTGLQVGELLMALLSLQVSLERIDDALATVKNIH